MSRNNFNNYRNNNNNYPSRDKHRGNNNTSRHQQYHDEYNQTPRRNSNRNYPFNSEPSRRNTNFADQERRGRRGAPYSPYDSRSRQSSRVRTVHAGPSVRREQEMVTSSRPSLSQVSRESNASTRPPDDIFAGWGNQPESFGRDQWNVASDDPSLLGKNPSNETSEIIEKKFSESTIEETDEDGIVWLISNSSSNLVADRPQSPMFDLDEEVNKKNSRYDEEKHRDRDRPRRYDDESFKDNKDIYRGVNFPPPFPIVPVSSSTDSPNGRPRVDRIFENESRSSALSFDYLLQIANQYWGSNADVPLDFASGQEPDLEEFLKINGPREATEEPGKKNDVKLVTSNKGNMKPVTSKPVTSNKDDTMPIISNKDVRSNTEEINKKVYRSPMSTEKPKERNFPADTPPSSPPSSPSSPSRNKRKGFGGPFRILSGALVEAFNQDTKDLGKTKKVVVERVMTGTSLQTGFHEAEKVRRTVNRIYSSPAESWLSSTLDAANDLKIEFMDKDTILHLIRILSSSNVLGDKNSGPLINEFITQPNFLDKLFNYMNKEVNWGGDLVSIIRLTDFIAKFSSEAAQNIPYNDIYNVCMRVGNTLSEAELDEVNARLKDIEDRIRKITKKVSVQSVQIKVVDQPKLSKQRPGWITTHSENRNEKPLIPSSDEIFDLEAMITEPILTPHSANQSWSTDYEDIYRQVHYDLLRTEVVEDLRKASIAFFAANCKGYKPPYNSPLKNYVFYNDVRVVSTYIKNFTPYVRVGFKPSRPVDWIKGEHLIYGTFVLLFKKTEFNNLPTNMSNVTMTWAIVEHFDLDDVSRPNGNKDWRSQESFVGLNFSLPEFEHFDINEKYIMLESTRNYASIRPVMEWLKESSIQKIFPLFKELFTCNFDDGNNSIPGYLENIPLDITSILVDQSRPLTVTKASDWPPYSNQNGLVYNAELSCVDALKQIISKKVAIIVAPVVTSKANLVSKAVEFLNRGLRQSHCFEPIFILTRSSYALDSILEQLLPSFPDLIRYGPLSKCNNPALKSRQIQDVANEHISSSSKKPALRKEWYRICNEMSSKQKRLADLWRFKKYASSLQRFVDSSPKEFKDQLVPEFSKPRGYRYYHFESAEAMLMRCLELWLLGVPSITEDMLYLSAKKDKRVNLTKEDLPPFITSSSQHIDTNNSRSWSNFVQGSNCPSQGRDAQNLPSLLCKLSESYLFEVERSDGYNDDEIPVPSDFDKEVLDHQIDDRVIFNFEEDQQNSKFVDHRRNEFESKVRQFWGKGGPIWEIAPEKRRSLRNNFCNQFDSEIFELQKAAIPEAEKIKSTLTARWTEVCNFTPVIGMTVSYATAYREILTAIKPRVCIVDEASEILESQLMFLIASDRLEHLIMFGDTQYSKPDVKSNTSQKNGLDVSLFERWIRCGGERVCLNQLSRMHPHIHELVRTLYDYENGAMNTVARNIPEIMGVSSNVFFMTHHNFDDRNWTSFKKSNIFEAKFVVSFAYYLYQQGYDPARITILTPYLAQKLLILESLKPELKQEILRDNLRGRFDKERNQTGSIKVELIDNYNSDENQIVLLSLVAVSEKWHKEALKTLNNKKRAIIALSRALHGLYIFGNEEMLHKSEVWGPVVRMLKQKKNFGKSLILNCKDHLDQRIEITTMKDFDIKVPFGGCSEKCQVLLKCGHECQRKCHPIQHKDEVNYICHRKCNRSRCGHECPRECHECEKSGKCPPCERTVGNTSRCGHTKPIQCYNKGRINLCEEDITLKLKCGHSARIKCHQRTEVRSECKELVRFVFPNCTHSAILPCSTRYPVCQKACGSIFPCGHRCQLQCGTEHSHERSDCPAACPKTLICGHMCANGCSEPDRHTSFCSKQCRIKCLHGRKCPRTCHEACTKCLEPCPWKCPHHSCRRKCNEFCDRPPCQRRCTRKLECNHQCNGFCGEECPPCLVCNPNKECTITLLKFSELEASERLYVLPECKCVFLSSGLDSYFKNKNTVGEHNLVKLWQCPRCEEPIFTAMRYNRNLKQEINRWNTIKHKQELARSSLSAEERNQIINAMDEETRATDFNSMVGGRWFVCPNEHPYYIGNCGGATQTSKCPECSETIGGTQHRVVSSNRFYGEFDNKDRPAWPGQR